MRVAMAAVALAWAWAGCATTSRGGGGAAPKEPEMVPAGGDAEATFVDMEHGFRIARPDGKWLFRASDELGTDTVAVPLVVSNAERGAQVVVQVVPAVATPSQLATRLSDELSSREGFKLTEVTPIPLAEGAVGFDLAVAEEIHGRVAVVDGGAGRVYVLFATWPFKAPDAVERDVDRIIGSLRAVRRD